MNTLLALMKEKSMSENTVAYSSEAIFTPAQKAVLESYLGGDFSYLLEGDYSSPEDALKAVRSQECALLTFLFIEMSHHEGAESEEEAIRRLESVVEDINDVSRTILKNTAPSLG